VRRRIAFAELLPGGEWLLYSSSVRELSLLSMRTGEILLFTRTGLKPPDSASVSDVIFGTNPHYIAPGYIVFLQSGSAGSIAALPFDVRKRVPLGPPIVIRQGVRQEAELGAGQFDVAEDGTMVYAPGRNASRANLAWMAPGQAPDTLPFPRGDYGSFKLSPDGKRLAVRVWPPAGPPETWLWDLERGTQSRVTQGEFGSSLFWWPDGRLLYSSSAGLGPATIYLQDPLGVGQRTALPLKTGLLFGASSDGRLLAVLGLGDSAGGWITPVDSTDSKPIFLGASGTAFTAFSPTSHWAAFTESGSGRSEIFALDLDHPSRRLQLSTGGGEEPRWSSSGDRIVYRNRQQWFAVDVRPGATPSFGQPRFLFEGPFINVSGYSHDLSLDGRRHVLLLGPREETAPYLSVVSNWTGEIKRAGSSAGPGAPR
jgi:serine/threonine-protein kinase